MSVQVGLQIQASQGTWENLVTSYSYQWQNSPDGISSWGNIGGATDSDYLPVNGDIGLYLRVRVVATNAGGDSAPAYSLAVGPVIAAGVTGTELIGGVPI